MDWDDFRYFSTLSHTGSVRRAAEQLGVNPSTVTRRLDALEQRLGVLLFNRSARGLRLTPEGTEVVQRVDLVRDQLGEIESTLKGRDQKLAGHIRVALPDFLAVDFLPAELARFTAAHPDIDLELMPGYQNLDISHTDIAIHVTDMPPEHLIGRPLLKLALAAYASRQSVAEHPSVAQGGGSWIEWAAQGEVMSLYVRLREQYFPGVRVHVRCDQVSVQHGCIRSHVGSGILPCYVGDPDETLVRLPQMAVQTGPAVWLLTHPELRSTRRIQTFMEFVREVFDRREQELSGALP